jgi:DNA-directed RNA polymerase I subunit RPA2
MRTTEVRALLPDAWGFVCPVHTPDGSPCGLLNHLAMPVEIVTHLSEVGRLPALLAQLGLITVEELAAVPADQLADTFDVLLDGRFMGWVPKHLVQVGFFYLHFWWIRTSFDRHWILFQTNVTTFCIASSVS